MLGQRKTTTLKQVLVQELNTPSHTSESVFLFVPKAQTDKQGRRIEAGEENDFTITETSEQPAQHRAQGFFLAESLKGKLEALHPEISTGAERGLRYLYGKPPRLGCMRANKPRHPHKGFDPHTHAHTHTYIHSHILQTHTNTC